MLDPGSGDLRELLSFSCLDAYKNDYLACNWMLGSLNVDDWCKFLQALHKQ